MTTVGRSTASARTRAGARGRVSAMRAVWTAALPALLALAVAGCAHGDLVYRAMYQALQTREEIAASPSSFPPAPRPSYDEYAAARRRLLDGSAPR